MSFLSQLSEKLEAQKIYQGQNGKYETRFKVEGSEYAFLATSVGGEYDDNTSWMLEFENIKSHRIGAADGDKKVIKAFKEAVTEWVKEKQPQSFYTYGSCLESIQGILEAVKKSVKGYNIIDDTQEIKFEDGSIREGNPVGKITWTKIFVEDDTTSAEKAEVKNTEFEKTYEEPKDIKPDKKFMSGTSQPDKLDKGDKSYELKTESIIKEFRQFKNEQND